MRTSRFPILSRALPLAAAAGLACTASAEIRVIYSEIPGEPTAVAPGLGINFTGLLNLHTSPNGEHWIFKGFVDDPENDVIVIGFGLTGAVVAREAGPTAVPGTTHSFLDSDCGINDLGRYAYGSRLSGATSVTDEVIFAEFGTGQVAAVRESDPAPGLTDPFGAGDEVYGNSLNSTHMTNAGEVAYRADSIENVDSDFESALYIGATPVVQEGTAAPGGGVFDSFAALSGNTFSTSADGSSWIVESDIAPGLSITESVVVNGAIVLEDGDVLAGGPEAIDAVFGVNMAANGDWYARGDFPDDSDWVVRNGDVIARTGAPLTSGEGIEAWGDAINGMNGNGEGDYIVTGTTSSGDPDADSVMVLNGTTVVAREGDGVDLDGNGAADDNVEIASFSVGDLSITSEQVIYAFVTLRDSTDGTALGDAFVRIMPPDGPCNIADLAAPFGTLNIDDVLSFLDAFALNLPAADVAAPMGVLNIDDVLVYLDAFAMGCP